MMDFLAQSEASGGSNAAVLAAWIAAGVSVVVALLNVVHDSYQRSKDRAENTRAVMDLGLREDMAVANSMEVNVHTYNVAGKISRTILLINLSEEPYLDLTLRCGNEAHTLSALDVGEGGRLENVFRRVRKIGILHPHVSFSIEVRGVSENQEVVPIVDFMLPSGRRFVHQGSRSVPRDVSYRRRSMLFFRGPKVN